MSANVCLSSYVAPVINWLLVQGATPAKTAGICFSTHVTLSAGVSGNGKQLDVCSRPIVLCTFCVYVYPPTVINSL